MNHDMIENLIRLRKRYLAFRAALPWLDPWQLPDEKCAFPDVAKPFPTPAVTLSSLSVGSLPASGEIAYWQPGQLEWRNMLEQIPHLVSNHIPLALKYNEINSDELKHLLRTEPELTVILGSGNKKILYFIEEISALLQEFPRFHLVTANFCNWYGVEQLCRRQLGSQLLYGSLLPLLAPDAAMAMIALADELPWQLKCDIAGNNLRRLIGLQPIQFPEPSVPDTAPFIIDAHGHSVCFGNNAGLPMSTPDMEFCDTTAWLNAMDYTRTEQLFLTPMETLNHPEQSSREVVGEWCRSTSGRLRYFETFDPRLGNDGVVKLRESLPDPFCVGIKIHPSFHQTDASDMRYRPAWELAARFDKVIMTHSWALSPHNPTQRFSQPHLFETHVNAFPGVRFVLGHAGGRPEAFAETAAICNQYPNVYVDLSGDYFHCGLIESLKKHIGIDKIIFASDVNWIDPRSATGILLGTELSDEELYRIFRTNAMRVYKV